MLGIQIVQTWAKITGKRRLSCCKLLMPAMVWMTRTNCECAIKLLCRDDSREFMGERNTAKSDSFRCCGQRRC